MQTNQQQIQHYRGNTGLGLDPIEAVRQEMNNFFSRVGMSSLLGTSSLLSGLGGGNTLGQTSGYGQTALLPVDVVETNEGFRITAEVPGLTSNDINIALQGDTLTISGQKYQENQFISPLGQGQQQGQHQGQQGQQQRQGQQGQQGQVYVSERNYGQFYRSFQLPQWVDKNNIQANCANGILTLLIPKSAEGQQQQRRIEVKSQGEQQSTSTR